MLSPEQIYQNIESELKDRGISGRKMLLDAGLKKNVMDNMKNGSMPSVDKLVAIADFLNVSTDFLLGREQNSENNSAPDDEVRSAISADETKTAIASVKMLVTSDGLVKTVMYQDHAEAVRDLIAMLEPNELSEVELFAEFLISKRHKKEFVIDPDFVNA